MVVIPAESSSPESEHAAETDDLVDTDVPAFQVTRSGQNTSGKAPKPGSLFAPLV